MSTPEIEFYVLKAPLKQHAWRFTCAMIEKAYLEGQRVFIHSASLIEAEQLDQLLWTFKDESFVPHELYQEQETLTLPVLLGYNGSNHPDGKDALLINLAPEVPSFYAEFKRVAEIVYADTKIQALARDRFRYYRTNHCEIKTIKLGPVIN